MVASDWLEKSRTSGNNYVKMRSFLPAVAEQLFRDIQKTYQETSKIPDDLLIALKFVFGSCALQALDLVDQRSVTCLSSPSGRKAFQVTGGSGRLYVCFLSCHYCPCPAFAYTVLRRNEGLLDHAPQHTGMVSTLLWGNSGEFLKR
ncbi:zinc finger SWIM domain-containing protein 7 isoform X2 [Melanotaenia boesemani]|uniref:zinc finger SWIM domain-containing protein 7 isoform X2 n=1 Tax=Melanotaenia boesemani TaxID=1250792 RepID=UPI001C03FB12|nr:zinc finger SWIM domain-containing protein 7 isoform X2 [Melanotaenia boesemani]